MLNFMNCFFKKAVEAVGFEMAENSAEQEETSDFSDFQDVFASQESQREPEQENKDDFDDLEYYLNGLDDDELFQYL